MTFNELVKVMLDSDLELVDLKSPGHGLKALNEKNIYWTTNQITIK